MNLRAAVIGCGWIGSEVGDDPLADGVQSHAGAYQACAATTLVGVCDTDGERAARAARRWGMPQAHHDVAQLLRDTQPQIVSVCTPDATHGAVLGQLLRSEGLRAIVAEKPLALELSEARALAALAAQRNVLLAVNYSRRFAPSHAAVRERLRAGEIGELLAVHGAYCKGVAHNGTHWFDLARWLVGEIVAVQAWPGHAEPLAPDPTCDLRLEFAGGQSGFLIGVDERHFTVFEMEVIGATGRVSLRQSGLEIVWSQVAPSTHYSGYRMLQTPSAAAGGFRDVALRMVEDVIEALAQGRPPRCTAADGLAALAIAAAARRSLAAQGNRETVKTT